MADQKISELTAATSAASADLLNIVQGGSNKKLTVANFLANLNSPVVINPVGADQDTRIAGDNDANLVYADAGTDKVGLGTSTPTEKLDVYGNLAITNGYLRLSSTPQSLSGSGSLVVNTTAAVTYVTTTGSATIVAADAGKHIYSTATRTITIDSNANLALPIGTAITFVAGSGATVTIAITTDTMYLAGPATTGSRTLAPFGIATALKITSTTWIISGNGLT